MKKIYFILTIIIFSISSQTYALDEQLCLTQADSYGDGRGQDFIDLACVNIFREKSNFSNQRLNSSEDKEIVAFKKVIFIENLKDAEARTLIYAGTNTQLENITNVLWDESNNEIAILDNEKGQVLYFSSMIDGNIAPVRILKSELLIGATQLAISNAEDKIYILNNSLERILIFSRLANARAPEGKRKLNLLESLNDLNNEIQSIQVNDESDNFSVIEKESKKTFNYKLRGLSTQSTSLKK